MIALVKFCKKIQSPYPSPVKFFLFFFFFQKIDARLNEIRRTKKSSTSRSIDFTHVKWKTRRTPFTPFSLREIDNDKDVKKRSKSEHIQNVLKAEKERCQVPGQNKQKIFFVPVIALLAMNAHKQNTPLLFLISTLAFSSDLKLAVNQELSRGFITCRQNNYIRANRRMERFYICT